MSQKTLPGIKHNPARYRDFLQPFESMDKLDEALSGFWDEFYELRNKYRLPDVCCVVSANVLDSAGEDGQICVLLHAGNVLMQEPMLAYAFGRARGDSQERSARAVGMGTVKTRVAE